MHAKRGKKSGTIATTKRRLLPFREMSVVRTVVGLTTLALLSDHDPHLHELALTSLFTCMLYLVT
jgi:hypothetical protein